MDSSIVGKCCWVSGAISHNEWEPVGVPALVEAHFSLHSLLIWPSTDTEPILRDQIWQPLSLCSAVLFLLGWAWASLSFNNMYVHAIPSRSAHTALFCSHLLPRFVPSQKCSVLRWSHEGRFCQKLIYCFFGGRHAPVTHTATDLPASSNSTP